MPCQKVKSTFYNSAALTFFDNIFVVHEFFLDALKYTIILDMMFQTKYILYRLSISIAFRLLIACSLLFVPQTNLRPAILRSIIKFSNQLIKGCLGLKSISCNCKPLQKLPERFKAIFFYKLADVV